MCKCMTHAWPLMLKTEKNNFHYFDRFLSLGIFGLAIKELEKHIYTDPSHEVRDSKAMRDNKLNPPPS